MTIRASFRTKLALAFLGLSLATAAIVLHFAWKRARLAQLEGLQSLLGAVTGAIAPEIDGDAHAALARASHDEILADPAYASLVRLGARVKASHAGFHEVFTLAFADPNDRTTARLILSAEPNDVGRAYDMGRFPAMSSSAWPPSST